MQSASIVSHLPLDDSYPNWYDAYYPEGAPPSEQNTLQADDRSILPGYFQTIGATLIEGRDFTPRTSTSPLLTKRSRSKPGPARIRWGTG